MNRGFFETAIGAVVLLIAGGFLYTVNQGRQMNDVKGGYQVNAFFDDVGGVSTGSDVRIGGVKIGVVDGVSLDTENYRAKVTLLIQKDIPVPSDSSLAIVGDGLLGGKFVSLEAGGDESMLSDGDSIEFTQSSVSLEQMLGKFIFSGGGVGDDEKGESSSDGDDVELSLP